VAETRRRTAIVTGASGGIGGAIASALAKCDLHVCLVGRDIEGLRQFAARELPAGASSSLVQADLATDDGVRALVAAAEVMGRVDVLVHAAGVLHLGDLMAASAGDLDELYRVNLRAPFLLTQALLPCLAAARGQLVFVSSSAALCPREDNGLYAATKAGLTALADSIRQRVNPLGVRVLSVFPGRTATRMQERIHAFEGKSYDAAKLLQPSDLAAVVVHALMLPRTAEVTEVKVRPMVKPADTGGAR